MSLLENAGASWVWVDDTEDSPNQYVRFLHRFALEFVSAEADLHISVDSNYAVWVNGSFVDTGQYHDFPEKKNYDVLDISPLLRTGENVLCILAYYQGENSLQYLKGTPGIIYAISTGEQVITSGDSTLARLSHAYRSGPMPRINFQLGFTVEYDAGNEDGWVDLEYTPDARWMPARLIHLERLRSLQARPVLKLDILPRAESRIVAQGLFRRTESPDLTVAELMQTDFLSARRAREVFMSEANLCLPSEEGVAFDTSMCPSGGGVYVLIDMGCEQAGLFNLDVDAQVGTVIDFAYGEHIDDLRVRASVGGRNFANRYICKDGRQEFTHYLSRIAGRYIELHIRPTGKRFILHYAGLQPTEYPFERKGSFRCPDSLHNRINEVAVRTLHLCMHEHYEDCPWREQGLYGLDTYIAATAGYYAFGNYDFAAAAYRLLGGDMCPDGYSRSVTAPSDIGFTLPAFTLAWIMAVAEHHMYSGDIGLLEDCYPIIRNSLKALTGSMVDGLLPALAGERYWYLYEWSDGLDGVMNNDCTKLWVLDQTELHSILNLFFCLALEAAGLMAESIGMESDAGDHRRYAEDLRRAVHDLFWDSEEDCYASYIQEGKRVHFAELTQSLAILAGVCPESTSQRLREQLASMDNGLVKTSLSHSRFKYEALLQEPDKYGVHVFERIGADWGYMLSRGATSFWETIKGADDFDKAGSLCHGWADIPAYFYGAYFLGVRPIEPGFRVFSVNPVRGVMSGASGRVPTPFGIIELEWKDRDGELQYALNYPEPLRVIYGKTIAPGGCTQ